MHGELVGGDALALTWSVRPPASEQGRAAANPLTEALQGRTMIQNPEPAIRGGNRCSTDSDLA